MAHRVIKKFKIYEFVTILNNAVALEEISSIGYGTYIPNSFRAIYSMAAIGGPLNDHEIIHLHLFMNQYMQALTSNNIIDVLPIPPVAP